MRKLTLTKLNIQAYEIQNTLRDKCYGLFNDVDNNKRREILKNGTTLLKYLYDVIKPEYLPKIRPFKSSKVINKQSWLSHHKIDKTNKTK